ncbi:hypothetical protein C8R42DRAFT_645781 [Lentinula raphanica]|nr:hypothetical protein C8R42DRAFT_645781 [Lentinula raphanica]
MRKKEEHNLVHQVALCVSAGPTTNIRPWYPTTERGCSTLNTQAPAALYVLDGAGLKIVYTRQAERVCLCLKREGSYDVEDDTTEPVRCIFKNTSSETCCLTKYREDWRGNSNIYTPEAEGTCCLTKRREDLQMHSNIYTPEAEGVTCSDETCCLTKQGRTCDVTSRRVDQPEANHSNKSDKTVRANNVQRAVSLATAMLGMRKRKNVDDREQTRNSWCLEKEDFEKPWISSRLIWGWKALNDELLNRGGRDQKAELAELAGDRPRPEVRAKKKAAAKILVL